MQVGVSVSSQWNLQCNGGPLEELQHNVLPSCQLLQASLYLWFYERFYKWFYLRVFTWMQPCALEAVKRKKTMQWIGTFNAFLDNRNEWAWLYDYKSLLKCIALLFPKNSLHTSALVPKCPAPRTEVSGPILNSTQLNEHVRTQVLTPQCPHLFNTTTYETTHLLLHVLIYLLWSELSRH